MRCPTGIPSWTLSATFSQQLRCQSGKGTFHIMILAEYLVQLLQLCQKLLPCLDYWLPEASMLRKNMYI